MEAFPHPHTTRVYRRPLIWTSWRKCWKERWRKKNALCFIQLLIGVVIRSVWYMVVKFQRLYGGYARVFGITYANTYKNRQFCGSDQITWKRQNAIVATKVLLTLISCCEHTHIYAYMHGHPDTHTRIKIYQEPVIIVCFQLKVQHFVWPNSRRLLQTWTKFSFINYNFSTLPHLLKCFVWAFNNDTTRVTATWFFF